MNKYLRHLNRIEFVITMACTGRCIHCSEGEHSSGGSCIDTAAAVKAVTQICGQYAIKSLMTFGGEPLLFADTVCAIHSAARAAGIPDRSVITNGYFSKDEKRIAEVAARLADSGVTEFLLSADAFHQRTIPAQYPEAFAKAVLAQGIDIKTNPAWLVSRCDANKYNLETERILSRFEAIGVRTGSGNIVFPSGNALKYLGEYFDGDARYENPYEEDPEDLRSVCFSPDGRLLGGNIYRSDAIAILDSYCPG